METAQVDWSSLLKTIPTYGELELRIHALEKEINNLKRCNETLHKSDLQLSQMLQGIFIPTFVIDSRRIITHWNKALENLTGLSAAEMIGTHDYWRVLYPSKDL